MSPVPTELEIPVPDAPKKRARKTPAEKPAEPARNSSYGSNQKNLVKLIQGMSHRYSLHQVFSDFVEVGALSLSNAVDWRQREKREERYLQIVKGYRPEDVPKFPEMFTELVLALEDGPSDVMGKTYHELELSNHWAGQYFTPYPVCECMAKMQVALGDELEALIEKRGFIRAAEPSCGSGAMMIALAWALKDAGINYQQQLHVTATDIDLKCVCMTYMQLSLLHIPAVVVHGNSLSLEEWGHWFTPAHILGGWDFKLRRREASETADSNPAEPAAAPVEAPIVETPAMEHGSQNQSLVLPPPPNPGSLQLSLF